MSMPPRRGRGPPRRGPPRGPPPRRGPPGRGPPGRGPPPRRGGPPRRGPPPRGGGGPSYQFGGPQSQASGGGGKKKGKKGPKQERYDPREKLDKSWSKEGGYSIADYDGGSSSGPARRHVDEDAPPEPTKHQCSGCGAMMAITSDKRPIKVFCPNCDTIDVLQ